jgi:hypothetical protein
MDGNIGNILFSFHVSKLFVSNNGLTSRVTPAAKPVKRLANYNLSGSLHFNDVPGVSLSKVLEDLSVKDYNLKLAWINNKPAGGYIVSFVFSKEVRLMDGRAMWTQIFDMIISDPTTWGVRGYKNPEVDGEGVLIDRYRYAMNMNAYSKTKASEYHMRFDGEQPELVVIKQDKE